MYDYKEQSRITRYLTEEIDVVRRIMDVDNSRVRLVDFGWVPKEKCHLPLETGDTIIYDGEEYTVEDIPLSRDGFSVNAQDVFHTDKDEDIRYGCDTELTFYRLDPKSDIPLDETLTKNAAFSDMCGFLRSVNYKFTPKVIAEICDNAYAAKDKLREKFRKSKFWNEDLQAIVVPDFKFETEPDYEDVKGYMARIFDYSPQPGNSNVYNVCRGAINNHMYKNHIYLDDSNAETLEQEISGYRYPVGAKVSKFLRGVFDAMKLGEDFDGYERYFAALSDAASPKEHKRLLVISLNVMDFLTMSEGNSWQSCHNIRKRGCYHGGCLSYAMDNVTAILYTLPADTDISEGKIWNIPKINRQLFMFGDTYVVESRLYPESAAMAIRKAHHKFVNKFYNEVSDKRFNPVKGNDRAVTADICNKTETVGNHYPDYHYNSYHITAMISDDYANEKMTIGSEVPDIVTGKINDNHGVMTIVGEDNTEYQLAFEDAYTGCRITDISYVTHYNGLVYCTDDCVWSECEDCYIPDHLSVRLPDDDYCSQEYADENYYRCDQCGEYVSKDYAIFCGDEVYCESCADTYLSRCDECGEYYRDEEIECVDDVYMCHDCMEEKTKVCTVCGERHLLSHFPNDGSVCDECVEPRGDIVLPDSGVIIIKKLSELKAFIKAAEAKGIKWKADDPRTVDVIRRTLMHPRIKDIGIVIGESMSYAPEADGLDIPAELGQRINFSELPTTETVNA